MSTELREELAELAHSQWSGWMDYLFGKCQQGDNGTLIIPKWAVDRWKRQSHSSFADLSENERESDRAEADKFIALLNPDGD